MLTKPELRTSRKVVRQIVSIVVILLTIGVFVYYIHGHPQSIRELRKLPASTALQLLAMYGAFLAVLTWIQRATLALCDIKLGRRESLLLVMYSSIINFFGPLQSGPAFRAAYLKRSHALKLKNYVMATLLYYAFFAGFNIMFLATYFVGLWALLAVVIALSIAPFLRKNPHFVPLKFRSLQLGQVSNLALATLVQVGLVGFIYFVELGSYGQQIRVIPDLIYTGAANFALFVSLTPGAIGFRESFLVFSQHLHHISNSRIVTASLIDRGVYILFLSILAIVVFGFHAQNYLQRDTAEQIDSSREIPTKNL